jgi:hypothetical protein
MPKSITVLSEDAPSLESTPTLNRFGTSRVDRAANGPCRSYSPGFGTEVFPKALGRDDEGAVLHGTDGVAIASWFFALRDLEEGEKAVITHIEEVMAYLLVGRVAAIAGASAKTGRYFHRMDERHTEHFDVKVDRRLNVVSAEREVVDAPRCR